MRRFLLRVRGMDEEDVFRRAFCKNSDGSWTCTHAATLYTPVGRIQVARGRRFFPGDTFMGFDVASWLEARLRDTALRCDET